MNHSARSVARRGIADGERLLGWLRGESVGEIGSRRSIALVGVGRSLEWACVGWCWVVSVGGVWSEIVVGVGLGRVYAKLYNYCAKKLHDIVI